MCCGQWWYRSPRTNVNNSGTAVGIGDTIGVVIDVVIVVINLVISVVVSGPITD